MARLPRLFIDGVPSHVIVRGNNRQAIVVSEGDRIFLHRCLAEMARDGCVAIHAYVLMTNHFHLLATGNSAGAIPRMMQRLGRRYVGYFNHLHKRTGTLWQGRYKANLVESERYLLTCQRYIELNPVRAGMVRHPGEHRWSSHLHNACGVADDLVTPHPLYGELASDDVSRAAVYQDLFGTDVDPETVRKIRDSVQHGWVLGTEEYCQSLATRSSRRPARLPLGRPKAAEAAQVASGHDLSTELT
ncbi:transposase [Usitatibacter palustris]|uniref:transposase n=1 Tax=Usitatibacter palustris TaxID=2732487 RepID=UPI001489CE60|nr:transposase [Usitatibacter palustris]